MTTQNVMHLFALSTVQQVSLERLQRAVGGLADGSITVHLTRYSERELRALATNSDGKEYGVTLTETLTACSCRDSLYRGGICKHAAAVALHALSAPLLSARPPSCRPQPCPAAPFRHAQHTGHHCRRTCSCTARPSR